MSEHDKDAVLALVEIRAALVEHGFEMDYLSVVTAVKNLIRYHREEQESNARLEALLQDAQRLVEGIMARHNHATTVARN